MRSLIAAVERIDPLVVSGRVAAVNGLLIEARGGLTRLAVGARVEIDRFGQKPLPAEVVGFRETRALLMPFGPVEGVAPGAEIRIVPEGAVVRPTKAWLGRIINAFGEPIDGLGPLPQGEVPYPLKTAPPPAHARGRVGERLDLGVRSMNVFTTTCRGQRLGIFAGSGVGKSVLLGMMTRGSSADVSVVGLIGERGREVKEFIEDILGPEGRKRAVVIAAPADASPLMRLKGCETALSCAEYFRDQGKDVLLLMDSLTRYAQAQREIALAVGEPPATKGYPPSVFARLPALVERAGNGGGNQGSITAFFTVLTEGDDLQDPIADASRAILDGHIVLSRALADSGHYPAIDIEKSISRVMPMVVSPEQMKIARSVRQCYSLYEQNKDLISIGAYQKGADPRIDLAIAARSVIDGYLQQGMKDVITFDSSLKGLLSLGQTIGAAK